MGSLVLSRDTDETVIIELPDGRLIKVQVIDLQRISGRPPRMRLKFEADNDIIIDREEVYRDRKGLPPLVATHINRGRHRPLAGLGDKVSAQAKAVSP